MDLAGTETKTYNDCFKVFNKKSFDHKNFEIIYNSSKVQIGNFSKKTMTLLIGFENNMIGLF